MDKKRAMPDCSTSQKKMGNHDPEAPHETIAPAAADTRSGPHDVKRPSYEDMRFRLRRLPSDKKGLIARRVRSLFEEYRAKSMANASLRKRRSNEDETSEERGKTLPRLPQPVVEEVPEAPLLKTENNTNFDPVREES